MGFFDFDSGKPKVTKDEFVKARQGMRDSGLTKKEADEVEGIFKGDLDESSKEKGISAEELDRGVDWLKTHRDTHTLSDDDIDSVERNLRKRL